ncbi:MAG: NADH-quinone oxidoreductase subunit NuoF [Deltaproteobacteria bacterium]|nr:NADH-quinone oxidoreductase subunit NuoF [Deltaproteobacteria bacterium]
MTFVLTKNCEVQNMPQLEVARKHGAYASLEKLFARQPKDIIEEVKTSGLRGRGGAGFPTGMKWSFVPQNTGKPIYLVVNADESEPGTFKDRFLLERDPHLLIEGIIAASYAIGSHTAYVYFRGEFYRQWELFEKACAEARAAGLIGKNILGKGYDLEIYAHRGAGAYICGEETALLSSLEGGRGYPRIKPPFPAIEGLFACPTIVNNVETICAVPYIVREGGAGYRKFGTEKSSGTKLFSVCGHVKKPGVYEVPLGTPFKSFFKDYCGGTNGRPLKAVIVGGSSVPVLTAEQVMTMTLDYEAAQIAGTLLGSGGMIIVDDSVCAVEALADLARFYAHESCGQCTPCREGTGWSKKILDRLEAGRGEDSDISLLLQLADNMGGKTICTFADALAMPIRSWIKCFRTEFEDHLRLKTCPMKIGTLNSIRSS